MNNDQRVGSEKEMASSTENCVELEELKKEIEVEDAKQEDPEKKQNPTKVLKAFQKELEEIAESEKKLEKTIAFMKEALAQKESPSFKDFWDARKLCLDLFKENINTSLRVALWTEYSELCQEARNLKEIFDEKSAFHAEQIEMAVSSIENEIAYLPDLMEKIVDIEFEEVPRAIKKNLEKYNELQRELNLLNTFATKTNALRKELIKTEMRIRTKNAFFERLSKLGDQVFPKRKKLIQEISQLFSQDVESFIEKSFVSDMKTKELFTIRDEIKALQSIAKMLTLNTEAFSTTRKSLSECWDSVKNILKDRKKEVGEKKELYKENKEKLSGQIDELKKQYEENVVDAKASDQKLEEIVRAMRKVELGKTEISELREAIKAFRDELFKVIRAEDEARREEANKRAEEKKARFNAIRDSFKALLEKVDTTSLEELKKELDELVSKEKTLKLVRGQKQELSAFVRKIKDAMQDKKERELLSDDQKQELDQLQEILDNRQSQRDEIKQELEELRKLVGGSGLDFAQAIAYNEQIQQQRERLTKIDEAIEEIELKIENL